MPTHEEHERFLREFRRLTPEQQRHFKEALRWFVDDLGSGAFRPALRVKRVVSHPGVWELSWDADGRATFQYSAAEVPGERHIVWRRIGTHDIFRDP
ncbi:MAG: hypothetical protein C0506_03725 [Anaerolinea sp.]|nr:hypothetical protein [Anaerolinea sp.]